MLAVIGYYKSLQVTDDSTDTEYRLQGNKYSKDPVKYVLYHMLSFLEMNLKDAYMYNITVSRFISLQK